MRAPELIVLNGNIVTMDPLIPRAEALAVTGGRVTALGSNAYIRALADRNTRIVEAGGRLVLLGVDGYQVVDVRSGELAWETPGRVLMWWAPLTDGTVVLGAGRTGAGAPTVEARRLSDGALEWALPLPEGVRSVTSVGGHLVLRTREELILYG